MTQAIQPELQKPKQTNLSKSKSATQITSFSQKLAEAAETNAKLKALMETIKTNAVNKKKQPKVETERPCTEVQIVKLKKKQGKLLSEIEQQINNLNVLISQNYKMKLQVDSSRNSRVIYSNIYKNLEKEIRKNQYLYKLAIIEGLTFQEIETRVKERVKKTIKRIEKEINEIQGIDVNSKKQKQKNRLDTGLSTFRAHKIESKDTSRLSQMEEITYRGLETKREKTANDSNAMTLKEGNRRSSRKMSVLKFKELVEKPVEGLKTDKSLKSRNKIAKEQISNEYFNLQLRKNYYDNVVKQLEKICGESTFSQIKRCWNNIEEQIEGQFNDYMANEEKIKVIEKKLDELENQAKLPPNQDLGEKIAEGKDIQEVDQSIKRQQLRVAELQENLSKKMDFNCSRLTNQEITHHILRMKNQNQVSSRQLQKLLQSVSKERSGTLMCSRLSQTCR